MYLLVGDDVCSGANPTFAVIPICFTSATSKVVGFSIFSYATPSSLRAPSAKDQPTVILRTSHPFHSILTSIKSAIYMILELHTGNRSEDAAPAHPHPLISRRRGYSPPRAQIGFPN